MPTCGTSRRSSIRRSRRGSRAALYYVLPNLAPFDVKAEVVHGVPMSARTSALTLAYAVVYIADRCCSAAMADLPPAGFQVTRDARVLPGRDRAAAGAGRSRCRCGAIAGGRAYEPATPVHVAAVRGPRCSARVARASTRSLADLYWIRAVVYFGRQRSRQRAGQELRPAVSAARPGHDARSALHGGLPVWRDLPRRSRRPADLAGPIWRSSCSSGASSATPDRWEYLHDIGFVHYWHHRDYDRGAAWFERAAEVPGRADLAEVDRGHDARRPAAIAQSARLLWRQLHDSAEDDAASECRRHPPRAVRRDGRDRPAQRDRAGDSRQRTGRAARRRGTSSWRRGCCAAFRSIRPACRIEIDPVHEAVRCRSIRRSGRCRPASTA